MVAIIGSAQSQSMANKPPHNVRQGPDEWLNNISGGQSQGMACRSISVIFF